MKPPHITILAVTPCAARPGVSAELLLIACYSAELAPLVIAPRRASRLTVLPVDGPGVVGAAVRLSAAQRGLLSG